ncbi:MAG: hypothetical protein K1X28_00620 [Parachlamydiales bacterium]|nr:hypothetical protein [Parachlamydiales bacterium]
MDSNNKIAALESLVDYLKTEISYLNQILVDCGFSEGITTLKMAVEEMLKGGGL